MARPIRDRESILERKKILMTMLEVGLGHKSPAIAVRDEIESVWPDRYRIDIVDFAKESGAAADDRALKRSWDIALAFPVSARIGYLLVELNHGRNSYIDFLFRDFVSKGIGYIAGYRPDLVFATHGLCLYVAVKAREILGVDFRIVACVIDPFDGYSWWANDGADVLLVASEQSRDRLVDHGIRPEKIVITGFPIHKRFFNLTKAPETIASDLGLDPDKRTILVTSGGQGIGNVFSYVREAFRLGLPFNIVVVAGRNAKTKARMDKLAASAAGPTRLVSLGYVGNINELIAAADVVVGKAGASSAMEAFYMGKPLVFTEWASYNDRYIVRFALNFRIGWYAPTLVSFIRLVKSFAGSGALEEYAANVRALALDPGTENVARRVVELVEAKAAMDVDGAGKAATPPAQGCAGQR